VLTALDEVSCAASSQASRARQVTSAVSLMASISPTLPAGAAGEQHRVAGDGKVPVPFGVGVRRVP
jgi:hypothetical protein